jgi:hypothetical protein
LATASFPKRKSDQQRDARRFVNETLWPEFQELSETLRTYLSESIRRRSDRSEPLGRP